MSSRWKPCTDSKGNRIKGYSIYVKTGVIHYRQEFRKLGIPPLQISTGHTTMGKAKTHVEVEVQKWKNKHLGVDDTQVYGKRKQSDENSFRAVAEDVLKLYTPTQRAGTQENHKYYIGFLIEKWGSYPIDGISIPDFERWILELRAKKFQPKNQPNRKPKLRRSFEDFAKNMNVVMRLANKWGKMKYRIAYPNPDIELIKKREGRRYTDKELIALWNQLNEDMKDQYCLSSECFMRKMEVLKLNWDIHINLKTGIVTLRPEDVKTGSKTGKGREFTLSPLSLERIRARYKKRNPLSPWVFPSPKDASKHRASNKTAWRLAKKRAGVTGTSTWHHLRHTALSRALLETGANTTKVSEYAGVSIQTIQRVYLHSKAEDTKEVGYSAQLPFTSGPKNKRERAVNSKNKKA